MSYGPGAGDDDNRIGEHSSTTTRSATAARISGDKRTGTTTPRNISRSSLEGIGGSAHPSAFRIDDAASGNVYSHSDRESEYDAI